MRHYAGHVWRDGRFEAGWLAVDAGRVVASGRGAPPARADATGVVLPTPVNAHTHVADMLARGRVPEGATLEEVVAPPDGLKHRILRAASDAELVAAIRRALDEAAAAGTRALLDFREGGLSGARLLREAAAGREAEPVVLARPATNGVYDAAEADAVLAESDGFGLSAIRDVPWDAALALARHARRRGKRFALHWSEGVHESADRLLDLAPDFAVHAVRATRDDLERVADARLPLVLCPRSNARLVGALPDARAMLDLGVPLCLGTDNAMLQTLSVWDELAAARDALKDVRPEELVGMAVDAPRRAGLVEAGGVAEGGRADLVVLKAEGAEPLASVFGGAVVLRRESGH